MIQLRAIAAAALLIGCAPGNGDDDKAPPPASAPVDAVRAPAPAHPAPALDPGGSGPLWRPPPEPAVRGRTLEIALRSTPPGATAAVDGKVIGATPTFWRGTSTGRAREFTFVLEDHAMARYRFVPTTSGVVHASLEPLTRDETDAGPQ